MIEQKIEDRESPGPRFGVAVIQGGEWAFSNRGSSSKVRFSTLGAGSTRQHVYLLAHSISADDKVIVYMATPGYDSVANSIDTTRRSVQISVKSIDNVSGVRVLEPDFTLDFKHPVWHRDLMDIFP